jgi:hypothetical protein
MRELYIEGVAIRGGPESCVGVREGVGEALPGHVWAGLLSREMKARFGVPTLSYWWKATLPVALSRVAGGPRAVGEPGHARNLHAREPGGPMAACPVDGRGRP